MGGWWGLGFRWVGVGGKHAHFHHPNVQFCLQQIKSTQSLAVTKDFPKAYNAAYGGKLANYPTLFKRRPDSSQRGWLPIYVSNRPPGRRELSGHAGPLLETNTTNTCGVAAITDSNHNTPTPATGEVSSTRESYTSTQSPLDSH